MDSTTNQMYGDVPSSPTTDGGLFEYIKNINATTWIVIVILLAFLGFNIFVYLAKGTQAVADVFAPITKTLFGTGVAVTSQAIDVSAEGAKAVVEETAGVLTSGLTAVQNITPNGATATSSVKGGPVNQPDTTQPSPLNKALNTAAPEYEAHEASSSVHMSGKAGWCYIGDDRGFRTCGEVGVNDTCMSGDIFPTQEICMNPNLRQ